MIDLPFRLLIFLPSHPYSISFKAVGFKRHYFMLIANGTNKAIKRVQFFYCRRFKKSSQRVLCLIKMNTKPKKPVKLTYIPLGHTPLLFNFHFFKTPFFLFTLTHLKPLCYFTIPFFLNKRTHPIYSLLISPTRNKKLKGLRCQPVLNQGEPVRFFLDT